MNRTILRAGVAMLSLAGLGPLCGCQMRGPIGSPEKFVKPVVAVESFENRAPFPLKWNLGDGMAEQLLASLVRSGRVTVVSRSALPAVFQELDMQNDPRFREEGRATPGRLKNAQYLVRGTVIDFSHVAGGGLHFFRGLSHGSTSAQVAVVTLALSVVDIESREVVTRTFSGRAWASEVSLQAAYKDTAFGGSAFYKTPLGKATDAAIWDAVHWVVKEIAAERWAPRIARIAEGRVYLNGGKDRLIRAGDEIEVVEPGEAVLDPVTGDELGREPDHIVGYLRVTDVYERYAIAEVVKGMEFRVGQMCRRVVPQSPEKITPKLGPWPTLPGGGR